MIVQLRWIVKELTIAVYSSRERLCEPIQCHAVEDLINWRSFIGPLNEFFTNPS